MRGTEVEFHANGPVIGSTPGQCLGFVNQQIPDQTPVETERNHFPRVMGGAPRPDIAKPAHKDRPHSVEIADDRHRPAHTAAYRAQLPPVENLTMRQMHIGDRDPVMLDHLRGTRRKFAR